MTLLTSKYVLNAHFCRVYDLQFMDKIYDEVAHDSEILSLTYSSEVEGKYMYCRCMINCIVVLILHCTCMYMYNMSWQYRVCLITSLSSR